VNVSHRGSILEAMSTSGLPKPTTDVIEGYLIEVRDLMIREFRLSVEEAEGRIARAFASAWDLLARESELALGHESPEYWAYAIYYGPAQWWVEGDHQPLPWPEELSR